MISQHDLLDDASRLVDAVALLRAHTLLESGKTKGKIVLEDF